MSCMKSSQPRTAPNRFKVSTSVTIHPTLLQRAHTMMVELGHKHITGLIEELIRREWERRHAPALMHDVQPPISSAPSPEAHADGIVASAQAETRRTRR